MLYHAGLLPVGTEQGEVRCYLCKRCRQAFANVKGLRDEPSPEMPAECRANGLWGGPDPPELQCLSYCEAKVSDYLRSKL